MVAIFYIYIVKQLIPFFTCRQMPAWRHSFLRRFPVVEPAVFFGFIRIAVAFTFFFFL
jgi:hypothetical protein